MSSVWLIGFALLTLIVLVQFYLIHQLFNQLQRINEKISNTEKRRAPELGGPRIGEMVPVITAESIQQQTVELGGNQNYETFIAFAAPDCKPCKSVFPSLANLERPEHLKMVVVSRGPRDHEGIIFFRKQLEGKDIPMVISMDVIEQFKIKLFPSFLLLDKNGKVIAKDTLGHIKTLEAFGMKEKKAVG